MRNVQFGRTPPVGVVLMIDEQRFELMRVDPHTRRDGTAGSLSIWMARCFDCGEPFETACSTLRFPETRRCELHRAPGKKVRP